MWSFNRRAVGTVFRTMRRKLATESEKPFQPPPGPPPNPTAERARIVILGGISLALAWAVLKPWDGYDFALGPANTVGVPTTGANGKAPDAIK